MGGGFVTILTALDYLAETLLPTVAVTVPEASQIQAAYTTIPARNRPLAALPAVTMNYELQETRFSVSFIELRYGIRLQVFVAAVDADQDTSMELASSYVDAFANLFSSNQTLDGNVSLIRGFSGASPETIVRLTWNGKPYVGLDLTLDVTLKRTKEHSA